MTMPATQSIRPTWLARGGIIPLIALALLAVVASLYNLERALPLAQWWQAMFGGDPDDIRQLVFRYSLIPRFAMAVIAGASLGGCGALMQLTLRNPLAEPTTLGVPAGAQLALVACGLWFPALPAASREIAALIGASAATLVVLALSWDRVLSPARLISGGLLISLYCGSFSAIALLLNQEALQGIYIWGAGSLVQNDWNKVLLLLPWVVGLGLVAVTIIPRSLTVLTLGDEGARGLGLSVRNVRLAALAVTVVATALVTSVVGVIAFVGLAAPALARLSGRHGIRDQILWSAAAGAAMLLATDQLLQLLLPPGAGLPTGIATAVIGAPILLVLIRRMKTSEAPRLTEAAVRRLRHPRVALFLLVLSVAVLTLLAVECGHGPQGWSFSAASVFPQLDALRMPRTMAALAAGALLAVAGIIMKRLTANPLASPEILGVSSGSSLGIISLLFLVPAPDIGTQLGAGAIGALAILVPIAFFGHRQSFSPESMILIGITVGTLFSAIAALLMISGDPRMSALLAWLSGSTYGMTQARASFLIASCLALLATLPPLARWLTVLPLGTGMSRAVGLHLSLSRFILILLAALMTSTATLAVGPLTFVGLLAPHMATRAGFQQPLLQSYAAAAIGALVMVAADWLGRNVIFPYEIPAGLFAAIVGGPYLLKLMAARAR
ncbi:Fe(3+)-hydroxamate ABC transporter permease FhuB [Rhizobium lusitanum]|uniref:Fe(3+)-hydroxamate ABC transporter permease FhuB n=1 Tax=Rhizobium lusitanum TaxID=293958 RepID=A0A6L9UIY0_9HYPH|nr:Fe(3+)-hydroxamate ABC transporter permease FhuB [Rhizobium lusitanum]NEI74528.1 Fe(3+)-hydroxamate ABC transporter permease FhuB [Rhizobium lusitanum]